MIGFLAVLASITAASSVLRCWIAWRDYEKALELSLATDETNKENPMSADRCEECGIRLTRPKAVHPQVPVTAGGMHGHVDAGLQRLIAACWINGIVTFTSCEGDPSSGLAYISFAPGSSERLVGAATLEDLEEAPDESLEWRMRAIVDYPGSWRWSPGGFPWGTVFAAQFPSGDIEELAQRLELWR